MVERVTRNHLSSKKHRMSDVKLPGKKTLEKSERMSSPSSYSTRSFDSYDNNHTPLWLFGRSVVILMLVLVAVLFAGARLFGRAHVIATPHQIEGELNTLVTVGGTLEADVDVVYETMTFKRTKTQSITAQDMITEKTKAAGTIVIFNENTTTQRLREETRFETPSGLIFMLPKGPGVTVPAARGDVPGSVEVTVYAQETGDEYNIGPTDFVIPGWREIEDDRFTTQYARSKGPMSSGGSQETPVISEEQRDQIEQDLKQSLREQMIAQAWVDAPETFILFEDTVNISFEPLALKMTKSGESSLAEASLTGTLSVILLNHQGLASVFASDLSEKYVDEMIHINNPSALFADISPQGRALLGWDDAGSAEILDEDEVVASPADNTFRVRFSGDAQLVMTFDEETIKTNLSGTKLKEVESYFASIPELKTAQASIKPFWRSRMPHADRITLSVE